MGDMNCAPGSAEMNRLFQRTRLCEPTDEKCTFPSWRPNRSIDHILVTPELSVSSCHVVNHACSDHLPVAMELILPEDVHLPS
jgi:endonuclease/exonuclease/phosphatase family metal-dependent hydrolase